jgi:SAM-dependent methyltransferase
MAYYNRYDDHYRSLYEQGISLWSDGPDHCERNIQKVRSFLLDICLCPKGKELLDVGCGEGHLALPLVDLGFSYIGIDCSPHAISKAEERVTGRDTHISFAVMDILNPDPVWMEQRFDIVLDQACLHMLVVDQDRAIYLETIHKLLKKDGVFCLSNQSVDEDVYEGPIDSIEEYAHRFQRDLSKPKRWEAWNGDRWVRVELPPFADRPKSRQGYIREFKEAGFSVEKIEETMGWGLDFKLVKAVQI